MPTITIALETSIADARLAAEAPLAAHHSL
jgi:hypothetical protein